VITLTQKIVNLIHSTIINTVRETPLQTKYRQPLVGFAAADDPLFKAIAPDHLLPYDLLPAAQTVVAYFLPFDKEIIEANRKDSYVARLWAEAYIETNRLISIIGGNLQEALASHGIASAWEQATHNFDPVNLRSAWSHKSIAYIAGLGTFGHHTMLITPMGCAGRFGSLVIDRFIPPTLRPPEKLCLYEAKGSCLYCVRHCPSGALTNGGLDRQKCYDYLLEVDRYFSDLGTCDVCGKCATGPCAKL